MSEHRIHEDDAGQRLDRYLRKLLPRATLAHLFKLLRQGRVRVNGGRVAGGHRLAPDDVVELRIGDELLAELSGRRTPATESHAELRVLYSDRDVAAVCKPAGLAMHAGTGTGDDHLVARVHARFGVGDARTFRPAAAHRLDRGTSGVVLFGLSARGLRGLTRALRRGSVSKRYLAVLERVPEPERGTIDAPLAQRDGRGAPKSTPDDSGRAARTDYALLDGAGGRALVEASLATGRTHQIRAHFASIGCPLLGDSRYGARSGLPGGARGFCLHAAEVRLAHPVGGADLRLSAAPPPAFCGVLRALGIAVPAS